MWQPEILKALQDETKSFADADFRQEQVRALSAFIQTGFPRRQEEQWRYTAEPLQQALQQSFVLPNFNIKKINVEQINNNHPEQSIKIIFSDGYLQTDLSTIRLPTGVILTDLKTILKKQHHLRNHLQMSAEPLTPFLYLNQAFLQNGLFLYVPKHIKLPYPIHIFCDVKQASLMNHLRHVIILEENASAVVLEEYTGNTESAYFNNIATQIKLNAYANLAHYKIQQDDDKAIHVAYTECEQASHSEFYSYQMSRGGKVCRNDLQINCMGEKAQCQLWGFYSARNQCHTDYHTQINHQAAGCHSEQHYRGLVGGRSRAIFNGKIKVYAQAAQTIAKQKNQNLLLSESAIVNSKPELEVYQDDVNCSHGATVGYLDLDSLFYLQSRGISEDQAKKILTQAFENEILEEIPTLAIKNYLLKKNDDEHVN